MAKVEDDLSKKIAERAMNELVYEDKTLKEWAALIVKGDYQKVIKGNWQILADKNTRGCSECGMAVPREKAKIYSFCPFCGAKNEFKYPEV